MLYAGLLLLAIGLTAFFFTLMVREDDTWR